MNTFFSFGFKLMTNIFQIKNQNVKSLKKFNYFLSAKKTNQNVTTFHKSTNLIITQQEMHSFLTNLIRNLANAEVPLWIKRLYLYTCNVYTGSKNIISRLGLSNKKCIKPRQNLEKATQEKMSRWFVFCLEMSSKVIKHPSSEALKQHFNKKSLFLLESE